MTDRQPTYAQLVGAIQWMLDGLSDDYPNVYLDLDNPRGSRHDYIEHAAILLRLARGNPPRYADFGVLPEQEAQTLMEAATDSADEETFPTWIEYIEQTAVRDAFRLHPDQDNNMEFIATALHHLICNELGFDHHPTCGAAASLAKLEIARRFEVIPEPEGGYTVLFPDMPGCLTCVDTLAELPWMVAEAYQLWNEAARASGVAIPGEDYEEDSDAASRD